MTPQGDSRTPAHRPSPVPWSARLRTYRDRHPRAFAARACGALLFVVSAFAVLGFVGAGGGWRLGAVLLLGLLLLTGTIVAVASLLSSPVRKAGRTRVRTRSTPLPSDHDPAKLAAAWKLIRRGVPGPDPEINRLGRTMVDQELGNTRTTAAAVLLLVGVSLFNGFQGAVRLLTHGPSPLVGVHLGLALLVLALACAAPLAAVRRRRRAEEFRDAYDRGAQGAPDATP